MSDRSQIIPLSTAKRTALAERPVNAEVGHYQRRERAAQYKLRAASWEEVKPVLVPLFDLGMSAGADPAGIKAGLQATCHNEPLWAIKQTVMAFVTGRIGSGFCPNSAEFGKAVRAMTDPIREEQARAARERKAAEQVAEDAARQPLTQRTRDMAQRFIENAKLISDQERMKLAKASGPDLSAYYKPRTEDVAFYKPLTPEDVKDIADAPPQSPGLQKMRAPGFDPLARLAARSEA